MHLLLAVCFAVQFVFGCVCVVKRWGWWHTAISPERKYAHLPRERDLQIAAVVAELALKHRVDRGHAA